MRKINTMKLTRRRRRLQSPIRSQFPSNDSFFNAKRVLAGVQPRLAFAKSFADCQILFPKCP